MKVYSIEKTANFYSGAGKAVALFDKSNNIVDVVYRDRFNNEIDFIKTLFKLCEKGGMLKYGMMSCCEFCSMIERPQNEREEQQAFIFSKEYLDIVLSFGIFQKLFLCDL